MQERGRELYGYAFALTESRDAADALVKEALYGTFRRGAGPTTVDEADAEVREQMRALSTEDRVRYVSDPSQSAAVNEAIATGVESLGSRNMTDAIGPATRRARKHRRNVALAWSASALVAVGAVGIATAVIAGSGAPEPAPSGIVLPAGTMDATYLISESSNRARNSQYPGPAGLKCEVGDQNPHLDPATDAAVATDCVTVWITTELVLTLTSEVSVDPAAGTITLNWSLKNGSYPVLLDRAGIIGVLTTGADGLAEDVSNTDTTLSATTTWTSASTQLGVLNSSEDLIVLADETPLEGSITWNSGDSTLLDSAIAGETPFQLGLQVRIGPRSDAGPTELLAFLTDDATYSVNDGVVVTAASAN